MLEELPAIEAVEIVFRFQRPRNDVRALEDMEFDREGVEEMLAFLAESRALSDPEEMLDMPFRPKPQLEAGKVWKTRFSDGGVRVLYSSLEPDTAEQEFFFWHVKPALGDKSKGRTIFCEQIQCRFAGSAKDLRPRIEEWPFLVQDGDEAYGRCQALAREAFSSRIYGFLTPSARARAGTNVPVFSRAALSNARIESHMSFTIDKITGEILTNRL